MPALRLHLFKSVESKFYRFTNPAQHALYKEVLTFDGGMAFATETELIVEKVDGKVFKTPLSHFESDMLTETYIGRFENGEKFRFIFASSQNPMAQIDPMVSFGSLSTTGWAAHFKVR